MSTRQLLPGVEDLLKRRGWHGFWDDFDWMVTAHRWTSVLTDSGTAALSTTIPGGVVALVCSDGSVADNDEAGIYTTNKLVLVEANKTIVVEGIFQYAEANTDDANILFGLTSTVGANMMQDDGAGPPTNYSGFVIFKADGDTLWSVECSNGTTQITTQTNKVPGGATPVKGRIEITPINSTQAEIVYFIDGQPLRDSQDRIIKHVYTYTSAVIMAIGFYAKNGGANLETFNVDAAGYAQIRR